MMGYPDKVVALKKEATCKNASLTADAAMDKILGALDLVPAFQPGWIVKRFLNVQTAYDYTNGLNSILIMVSEDSLFYGFSQYFTTSPRFNVELRIVRGEQAVGPDVIHESRYDILCESRDVPERVLEGVTPRTYPVFLSKPVLLQGQIWYNLSFRKPVASHFIYYGAGPISNAGEFFMFSEGTKRINFRRAGDDTIDNSPSMGQFPDLYIR